MMFGAAGGLAITLVGGLSYVNNEVGGMEGLTRSMSFYSLAIPVYVKYRYLMWKGDTVPEEGKGRVILSFGMTNNNHQKLICFHDSHPSFRMGGTRQGS